MMKNSLYIMLATMLLSFASCTSDEMEVMDTPTGKGEYTVRFSIDNPSEVQSRAYDHLEGKINQLYAVVFDGTGADAENLTGNEALKGVYFVEVEESTTEAGTYDCSFRMDQSGDFVTCFVANANTELVDAMKGATDLTTFKNLVAKQAPETFLMTSQEFLEFTLDKDNTTSDLTTAEAVKMQRSVARIDVENSADDLTITKIVFKNRAIQSVLWRDIAATIPAEYVETSKTYTTSVAGNSTTPGLYQAEIYTYEWMNATDESAPSLEFSYTLKGNAKTFSKTLDFVRTGEGNTRTHVNLKRNNKYTVKVQMSDNKINFVIKVLDWETGEEDVFNVTHDALADKETAIRPDQNTLNEALKVYDLFTEFNVASVEGNIVTFETELDNNADAPATNKDASVNGYFTYDAAMALGNLADNEGNSYRLPTAGELNLLLPTYSITNTVTNHPWWNDNTATNTAGNHINTEEYKETIYLEDADPDENNYVYWDTTNSLTGWSRMTMGTEEQRTTVLFNNTNYNVRPIYAYRFKGTDQYAAYRWESCKMEGSESETERYLSVKIKALSNYHDADITLDEIADDESFWADGYIEYKFPASGYYHYETGKLTSGGVDGYCWSSSRHSATSARNLGFSLRSAGVGSSNVGGKFPLRLVKVSQE